MVTQEQIDFFQENGYVKFGKVLDSDGVEAMRAGLDAVIELELTEGDDSSPEFKYGHDRRENQLNRGEWSPACDSSICEHVEAGSTLRCRHSSPTRRWNGTRTAGNTGSPPLARSGLFPNHRTITDISDSTTISSFGPSVRRTLSAAGSLWTTRQSIAAACTLCRKVTKTNSSQLKQEQHSTRNQQKRAKQDANRLRTHGQREGHWTSVTAPQ